MYFIIPITSACNQVYLPHFVVFKMIKNNILQKILVLLQEVHKSIKFLASYLLNMAATLMIHAPGISSTCCHGAQQKWMKTVSYLMTIGDFAVQSVLCMKIPGSAHQLKFLQVLYFRMANQDAQYWVSVSHTNLPVLFCFPMTGVVLSVVEFRRLHNLPIHNNRLIHLYFLPTNQGFWLIHPDLWSILSIMNVSLLTSYIAKCYKKL